MTFRQLISPARAPAATVSRRDFLTMSTRGTERVLELSCEPLFMRYVDAQSSVGIRGGGGDSAEPKSVPTFGEPPTDIDLPTARALFAELEKKLGEADVLRIVGHEWLTGAEFGQRVAPYVDAFAARGGRIEYRESR